MKYYLIAGEASGDHLGAHLISDIKRHDLQADFRFWGGDQMSIVLNEKPITHIKDMAFMGFIEVARNIVTIRNFFRKAKQDIMAYNPDGLILIDYPGFNLKMAKWASLKGYKVIYYVSPSVWAWHKSRVYLIEKYVNLMICILPFEVDFYKDFKVNVKYFGNPNAESIAQYKRDENFKNRYQIEKPILAILPGSRKQEIQLILPEMIKAAYKFQKNYEIIIAKADNLPTEIYEQFLFNYTDVKLIAGEYKNILSHASLAIVTSGTATLETALFRVPQVVCYKTSWLTYQIAKRLVNVKYISLVNLIVNRMIVKELIQEKCNSENIVEELKFLIDNQPSNIYQPMFNALEYKDRKRIGEVVVGVLGRH